MRCGILACFVVISDAAYAAANLPGSADPGRALENLKSAPEPTLVSPEEKARPQPEGPVLPDGADQALKLRHVVIEGATAYPPEEIEAMFAAQLRNHSTTLRALYETLGRIEQKYHRDGYVLAGAFLPPQDVTDGKVTIRIVEGHVASVEAQGNYRTGPVGDAIMAKIRNMNPFRVNDLERNTLLLGDATGLPVHAVLKPGTGADGSVGVVLEFDEKAVAGSVSFDNLGTRYSGPAQYGISVTALNRLIPEQQTTISGLATSPLDNLKYIALSERIAIDAKGDAVTFQGNYANTQPGFRLKREEIEGDSFNYGVSLMRPVIRSRVENLYLTCDLTAKDVVTDALQQRLYADRLRIASAQAHYDIQDKWSGADLAEVKLSQGLDLPGVTKTGTLNLSRADGHSDFTRVTGNASRLQAMTEDVRLFVAAEGQYAWSPLLSSEQFGFGGQQFGRAFDPSELTGDDGIAGAVELRYTPPIHIPNLGLESFAFADAGRVWNYTDGKPTCASSVGIGARYSYGSNLWGMLTLAQPINHEVAAPSYGNGKNPRVFFSLNSNF